MTTLQQALTRADALFIRQRKNWGEIIINVEARNAYEIFDQDQANVGFMVEQGSGIGAFFSRMLLRSHRGFTIQVLNQDRSPMMSLTRRFFFFFSDLEVTTPDGARIGSIHRRFAVLRKKYDLQDASGRTFAVIRGGFWRIWTFPILKTGGSSLGPEGGAGVFKKWGGAMREFFTDSDTYQVAFGREDWTPQQKAVILACGISIDFDFFEDNGRHS